MTNTNSVKKILFKKYSDREIRNTYFGNNKFDIQNNVFKRKQMRKLKFEISLILMYNIDNDTKTSFEEYCDNLDNEKSLIEVIMLLITIKDNLYNEFDQWDGLLD